MTNGKSSKSEGAVEAIAFTVEIESVSASTFTEEVVVAIQIRRHGKVREIVFDKTKKSRIVKFDEDRRIVFGWANVSVRCSGEKVVDHHDEMIDPDVLEDAAYSFVLNFGDMGEDHEGTTKGRLIESFFVTPEKLNVMGIEKHTVPQGWWVGFYVDDEKAWKKVKAGKHRMFSIQGICRREEVRS